MDPHATFKLYRVQTRPLTPEIVQRRLARAARTPDGRLRGVAVTWLGGKVLGAFDMLGRRPDDPNDRIPHEDRRSLRASWMLAAWLAIYDASAINTLDSYVEEDGRRFVRHYMIDFGAGLGSGTGDVKGLQDGGQYLVEFGRSLASMLSLGLYRRPYQSQRVAWRRGVAEHPAVGWLPAEDFDVEAFRTGRKVPAHKRMTDRDAYWGAKLVTSFTDAQLGAVAEAARIDPGDAAYLARTLAARRDVIGRRYLTGLTAVEAPAVITEGGSARICFDDLAVERGYVEVERLRYRVSVRDGRGRPLADANVRAQGPRTCVAAPDVRSGYRVVAIGAELAVAGGSWRAAKASRIHVDGDASSASSATSERGGVVAIGGIVALALALLAQASPGAPAPPPAPQPIVEPPAPAAPDPADAAQPPACGARGEAPDSALQREPRWARATGDVSGAPGGTGRARRAARGGASVRCRGRRDGGRRAAPRFPWLHAITTSDDGKVGVRPEIQYATGFTPSVGGHLFYRRLPDPTSEVAASFRAGSSEVMHGELSLRGPRWLGLTVGGLWDRRDDRLFAGIGNPAPGAPPPSSRATAATFTAPRPSGSRRATAR